MQVQLWRYRRHYSNRNEPPDMHAKFFLNKVKPNLFKDVHEFEAPFVLTFYTQVNQQLWCCISYYDIWVSINVLQIGYYNLLYQIVFIHGSRTQHFNNNLKYCTNLQDSELEKYWHLYEVVSESSQTVIVTATVKEDERGGQGHTLAYFLSLPSDTMLWICIASTRVLFQLHALFSLQWIAKSSEVST
jgi:hypothetical protein